MSGKTDVTYDCARCKKAQTEAQVCTRGGANVSVDGVLVSDYGSPILRGMKVEKVDIKKWLCVDCSNKLTDFFKGD